MTYHDQVLVFDADDTLWENNVRFERVVTAFLDRFPHPVLDRAAARAVFDDVQRANVRVHGYGAAMFLRSLGDCFERLTERPATDAERREIDALASSLADRTVELVPGVAETLTELGTRHDLLLLTKGEAREQQTRSTPRTSRTTSAPCTSWPRRTPPPTGGSWSTTRSRRSRRG